MALSRDKKQAVVAEISQLLAESKLVVAAQYPGTSVQAMQQLRRTSKESGTQVKVVKNRLFKQALGASDKFKELDASLFSGQLIYAFNSEDEVAPAQNLAKFAKEQPQIQFVGAITADGQLLSAAEVKQLADLPTKDQLRGQLVSVIAAPLTGMVGVMSANLRGVINVMNAHAEQAGN